MPDYAVRVNNVSKKFCKRMRYTMMYGTLDLTNIFFNMRQNFNRLRTGEFWALKDIDFEIKKGEAVGLIGANGAGKSTMLKLLNGIYMPDNGDIEVYGRVGALIQVGAGFHPMLTGRENVYVNGEILGMRKKFIDKHFDEIVDFAGIGDFIDTPVKHYSSGMYVRLGFAVVAFCQPEILLVDEVLSVGDAKFRRKCLNHLSKLQKQGVTFIIVSHNMLMLEGVTDRGIFFDNGKMAYSGLNTEAISRYELKLLMESKNLHSIEKVAPSTEIYPDSLPLILHQSQRGTNQIHVQAIHLMDADLNIKKEFYSDETVMVETIINSSLTAKINLRVYFRNDNDETCLGTHTSCFVEKGYQIIRLTFNPIQLTTGKYILIYHIFDESFSHPYSNGHYGYFSVFHKGSISVTRGLASPFCWVHPKVSIAKIKR